MKVSRIELLIVVVLVFSVLAIVNSCSTGNLRELPDNEDVLKPRENTAVKGYELADKYISDHWEEYDRVKMYFKHGCKAKAFFKSLAKLESNFAVETQYIEPKINGKIRKDYVTGKRIVSEGLFQMSYQDSKLWKCRFDYKERDIFNPTHQAHCALEVLNRMIRAKGTPFYNTSNVIANYWFVLKPRNHKKYGEFNRLYSENQKEFCK